MAAKQSSDDQFELKYLYLGIVLVLFAVGAWYLFGERISSTMAVLRRYEIALFAPFFDGARVLHEKLVALDGRPLVFRETLAMLSKSGTYVRWLFAPVVAGLGVWLFLKSNRTRFSARYDMAALAKSQVPIWPTIAPVAGHQKDLVAGDIRKGRWAVNKTEWEFAEEHNLAKRGGELNRAAAREVFVRQLGPRWAGTSKLPKHAKGMLGALLLRIAGEKAKADEAFALMAKSYAAGAKNIDDAQGGLAALDVSFADEAIAKYMALPLVQKTLERHAYVFTVFATLLQVSRSSVLASAQFTWLRPVDRRLWYTLNGVGREAFTAESAGIHAHWLFEKTVGVACPTPMVEKAVEGLAFALNEYSEDKTEERLFK